jgi:hypothetical protein
LSWNILGGFPDCRIFHLPDGGLCGDEPLAPFDLPEAESELTAGYHTEYSSMKFAMFFMAEYANMITVSCVATLLFFGGCDQPRSGMCLLGSSATGPDFSCQVIAPVFWFVFKDLDSAYELRGWTKTVFLALPERIGCPILRAFCEGWDKQALRGSASGEERWHPTLRQQREGWGTRSFWRGKKDSPLPLALSEPIPTS